MGPKPREVLIAGVLFLATLASVFYTYGTFWEGGDPFTDPLVLRHSAQFAGALMAILGAHELGHYVVARLHGFRLSLPYFIPFPSAFGTMGAVIRLRSRPPDRSALLEMGAAGPLAGFVVALGVLAVGLPETGPPPTVDVPPELILAERQATLDFYEQAGPLRPIAERLVPLPPLGSVPVMVFANPKAMDLVGMVVIGRPPGRFDSLSPLGMAGWVGCLLTGINLVPIGQLDGGHVLGALTPTRSRRLAKWLLGIALAGGLLWAGWAVWALLLLITGAWRNLPVPERPPLTLRARFIAGLVLVAFALCFMPVPIQNDYIQVQP